MRHSSRALIASTCLFALVLLAACGESSPEDLLKIARGNLAKNDTTSAVLHLKSALQQRPDSAEIRFLLGKVLLETGDVASAVVELRKAMDLQYPINDVAPLLAKAMLSNRQYQKVADEFAALELTTPTAAANLKTSVAAAYASLGNAAKAQGAIQAALKAMPDFPATLAVQARIAAVERRGEDAVALMDKVLAATPNDAQAWFEKGEILLVLNGDAAGATEAFRKALSLQPAHAQARAGLVSVMLGQRDLKGADEQLAELRKTLPNHVQTLFFDAQLAFANGNFKKARELIELVQKTAPDDLRVLQLAGTIHLANDSLLLAERVLSRALALHPNLPFARRRLAQTLLRMGQPTKALAALQPMITGGNKDPRTYALAGEAHIQAGNLEQARISFESAVKLDPANSSNRTYLALAKLKSAGFEATVSELQKIAAADKGTNADLALISMLLNKRDLDRTLKAIDAIEGKLPKNPLPPNLRGRVQLLRQDVSAARASFEQALAIDPVFVPAVASLATLDLEDKNPTGAKKRFDAVLAVDPNNLDALLAIAKLRAIEGAPKSEITSLLAKALQLNPTEPAPRLLLIDQYLDQRDFKAALAAAHEAYTALPDRADLVDALGRAQMTAGDSQQAINTFNKLVVLEPKSTRPLMRLASVQLTVNNPAAAEQNLRRALGLVPNSLPAQQALVKLAQAGKRFDEAVAVARTVQEQRPSETTGHDMEAATEVARNNRAGAVEVYRRALKKYPVWIMAVKLHTALRGAQQVDEADRLAAHWTAGHPRDVGFLAYLGDLAMVQGQYDQAERHFKAVIALQPKNAAAHNNVAMMMVKQNKPGATAYAEQALKLHPNTPGMMDTLASALAAEKQLPKALEVQKQAVALAPNDQVLHLNLAKLQLQAGDKPAALLELKALEKLGHQFPAHAEVARLLKAM